MCISERSVHTSHLSLSPYKLKDQCALLKYWCALLKTSTVRFFSIVLRTSDICAALLWSNTFPFHFRKKLSGLTLFAMEGTLCTRQILLFVVGASGILRKWNFQRTPYIFQGFWIKEFFFSKILYLKGSGPFVRTFSQIWKIVFTWSMSQFSQQKFKLLAIYSFLVSSVTWLTKNT